MKRTKSKKQRKPKEPEGPFHTDTSLGATRLAWRPEDRFSVTHSGKTEPILPMLSADTGIQGGATKSEIERRLSEQPADIRNIARALSTEFKSQANELKQQRWNDKDRIAQRDNLLVLSNGMAAGFAKLADNLDRAISKGSNGKLEPVFLGKAAEVVQGLHFGFMRWLNKNRTAVFDVSCRVGLFVAGAVFLLSVFGDTAAIAVGGLAHILRSPLSNQQQKKKHKK